MSASIDHSDVSAHDNARSRSETTVLITECDPDRQAPGKRRRYEHVEAWLDSQSVAHENHAIRGSIGGDGLAKRTLMAARALPRLLRATRRHDRVWVLGLGEVHMLALAGVLSVSGRQVTYDACDSWSLQILARADADGARTFVPRIGAFIQRLVSHKLSVSYISDRDRRADVRLCGSRQTLVIGPVAPKELSAMEELSGNVRRVVAAVDMQSFHNASGFQELLSAWEGVVAKHPSALLEIFGLGLPPIDQANVRVRGWVDSLREVYEGNTAVFVTNQGGSGVPNKLVEAVAARRPVVVHESVADLVEPSAWRFVYASGGLDETLDNLLSSKLVSDEFSGPHLA